MNQVDTDQADKAKYFAKLHARGNPCLLYNTWDAGSAKAVARAGARAIASGSWSVAAAQGYEDGQAMPLDLLVTISQRICQSVSLPVTVDFEGGYAVDPVDISANTARIIESGAVGVNFEDQVVGGDGLHGVSQQCERIAAVREAGERERIPLFINARTDLFLQAADANSHHDLVREAKSRAAAYKDAGASGIFVPGLIDEDLIAEVCTSVELPVNVMMMDGAPPIDKLAALGVSRVSWGPAPYRKYVASLEDDARRIYSL